MGGSFGLAHCLEGVKGVSKGEERGENEGKEGKMGENG